jgi:hypothetical protein
MAKYTGLSGAWLRLRAYNALNYVYMRIIYMLIL